MVIYNEQGERIESPDLDAGYVETIQETVYHAYVVDAPAVTHEVVIAEYPETGGKDVEIVEDEPERGHWETMYENGDPVEDYDGTVPEGLTKDQPTADIWEYGVYHTYTAEELEEMERQRLEAEAAQVKAEKQQAWLDGAPAVVEDHDAAIVALYEGMTEMQLETDEMLTALYEQSL